MDAEKRLEFDRLISSIGVAEVVDSDGRSYTPSRMPGERESDYRKRIAPAQQARIRRMRERDEALFGDALNLVLGSSPAVLGSSTETDTERVTDDGDR